MNGKKNLCTTFSILNAPQKNDFLKGGDKMIAPTILPSGTTSLGKK